MDPRRDLLDRLDALRKVFNDWRRSRRTRRIPEELWKEAATVALDCGVHATARAAGIHDMRLRARVKDYYPNATPPERMPKVEGPQRFVEVDLGELSRGPQTEILLEREEPDMRIRLHVKGLGVPEVSALLALLRGS